MNEEILQEVASVLSNEMGAPLEGVNQQTRFRQDLGFDDLDMVTFQEAVEREFDISISDEEMERINNVEQLVRMVDKLLDAREDDD